MNRRLIDLTIDDLADAIVDRISLVPPVRREFYTVADFAEAVGISGQSVLNRIHAGTLAARREDGERVWLIPASELERYRNDAYANRVA